MPGNDARTTSAVVGDPCCPLCGREMEVVERFDSRWWYCDGEGHAYSRQVEP